jgi:iron complex outermembrane receptor protein
MKRQYCVKKQLYCNLLQNKQNQTQLIMKKLLLLILLNASFLFAQKDVSGVVKDNTGNHQV